MAGLFALRRQLRRRKEVKQKVDYSKLKGLMREKGVTQAELAKKVGINECTLNFKLNNKAEFRQDEILKVCEVLKIDIADLPKYFFCRQTCKNTSLANNKERGGEES